MTVSSFILGLAGIFALFVPYELLGALNLQLTNPLPVIIQILGALYLSFALTNWIAKDSIIGGVYARPTSMGNFAHFTIGTLALAKFLFTDGVNIPLFIGLIVYAVFAIIFGWLAFVYSGIARKHEVQE
ncbi:MAG: hypothetical protein IPM84_15255 [Anaerolineae bacterium]|nr:hypothetical protein [Anaerolineae bacterium]